MLVKPTNSITQLAQKRRTKKKQNQPSANMSLLPAERSSASQVGVKGSEFYRRVRDEIEHNAIDDLEIHRFLPGLKKMLSGEGETIFKGNILTCRTGKALCNAQR